MRVPSVPRRVEPTVDKAVAPVRGRGGWLPVVLEAFSGAWQRNVEVRHDDVLTYHAVYACMTLIASDIAKMRMRLVEKDADGIWSETSDNKFSPVLAKPNKIQNRIQFYENWILSKLGRGNTYILKGRDTSGGVTSLHVLDPSLVTVLVSDDGAVFYELRADNVNGIAGSVTVPAREIIHDRFNCLYHPLVGTSPLVASGLTATQGLNIQRMIAKTYEKGGSVPGILTAPGAIGEDTAKRLKDHWEANYTGDNAGRVAVLGDGLKFERMVMTSVEAQLLEQLRWTAEVVCSVFHVPPYKIGVGAPPSYNNIQSLHVEYYSQALQRHIEDIELCLDEGLETGGGLGAEFDLDDLLRMDSVTLFEVAQKAKGVLTLDEQRKKVNAKKTAGGHTIYMQQQDHSIEAIAARDAQLIAGPQNIDSANGADISASGGTDVQATALNGAQVNSLMAFLNSVSDGSLPADTAVAAIAAAFPLMSADEIAAMVDPLRTANPPAVPAVEPPVNDNAEAEAKAQASKAIIEMMKGLA